MLANRHLTGLTWFPIVLYYIKVGFITVLVILVPELLRVHTVLLDYLRNIVATVLHIFVCIINGEY